MASGRYERRAARQGIAAAHQSLETASRLARFGQIAGAVGNVIGIIDAFSMLADAEKAERKGELSQFTDNMYLLVGVNVAGAVVGLIFSSVVIPLLISLFAIWIAGQIIHYVPLGIRVWVRRSIFGVPGRQEAPFASLEEEQESLEMVIRGISVDIDVIQRWRRIENAGPFAAFEQADHPGEEPYTARIKLLVPKLETSILKVDFLQVSDGMTELLKKVKIIEHRQEDGSVTLPESTVVDEIREGEPKAPSDDGFLYPDYESGRGELAVSCDLLGFPETLVIRMVLVGERVGSGCRDELSVSVD
ncbi:hypothetical protein [Salinicola avicenniae]|uniref:hypothetical protein n=1 Tax=Salinicola avicenniae TaxID=2916836 RepID=UPI0020735078|nr:MULTISPECIES: hypothetical protein [unclassified Salinicola]